ncbi:MAG: type II toxin-antitoxin system RelE/ParE family toxin [Chloroflexi bacterium]|nr:MAG: type II toxin-antitoxin system RelE/ParE family toxin [Chloroflexota bacterium]
METRYRTSFQRDLKRIKDKTLLVQVRQVIAQIKQAKSLNEIPNLRKLKGFDTFYRIRLGDYRIGIEVESDTVIFTRLLHRKDIYRYFP